MKSIIRTIIIITIVLLAITGCSKGSSNPVQPDTGSSNPPAFRSTSGRSLIGAWEIHLRSDVPGADVRINRTIQSHIHVEGTEGFEVEVFFDEYDDSVPNDTHDYSANFISRGGVIWRLQIGLTNNTANYLYDVRGIIMTNKADNDALGLHNADGLTTLWDEEGGDDFNPFKYYGDLSNTGSGLSDRREFQVIFTPPPDTGLDCSTCTWPGALDSEDFGGGKWDPGGYITDDAWINFAVDASIEDSCLEPYLIFVNSTFEGDLSDPAVDVDVIPFVHSQENEVTAVSIELFDPPLPGYVIEEEYELTKTGLVWGITFDGIPEQDYEGIYHARVKATSKFPTTPPHPDPYNNPYTMYKDVRLFVGDFDELIDDLFPPDIDTTTYLELIGEILQEWDEREEGIYHETTPDGFYKEDYFHSPNIPPTNPHFLLIKYKVGDIDEYGVLRIPANLFKPDDGWPMIVFCHWKRFVCYNNPDGFMLYNDNLNKFAILIPKYRGNALCWVDGEYKQPNEEVNSPADYDVDDVLAFLNVVIEHQEEIEGYVGYDPGDPPKPLLNDGRVGIMGGSRGGSPAYLAKIRDRYYKGEENRIDGALITIGSAADFFTLPGINESCDIYIKYDGYVPEPDPLYPPLPPEDDITHHYYNTDYNAFARVLEPYLHEDLSFNDARKRLIRSSPRFFTDYLDHVRVHHGMLDQLVRPAQTMVLESILGHWPDEPPYTEFHLYWDQYHGIALDADSNKGGEYGDHIQDWLNEIGGYD